MKGMSLEVYKTNNGYEIRVDGISYKLCKTWDETQKVIDELYMTKAKESVT